MKKNGWRKSPLRRIALNDRAERNAAFSRAFMDALREEMAWGSALPGIESV